MKAVVLAVAIAFAATGCTNEESGPPLTATEYGVQGNAICDQMNFDLDQLSTQFSSGLSPEEQRALAVEANAISRDGIDDLFALTPPASLDAQRQRLLELAEERRELIVRLGNGEDVRDRINEVNHDFEVEASGVWPSCSRQ